MQTGRLLMLACLVSTREQLAAPQYPSCSQKGKLADNSCLPHPTSGSFRRHIVARRLRTSSGRPPTSGSQVEQVSFCGDDFMSEGGGPCSGSRANWQTDTRQHGGSVPFQFFSCPPAPNAFIHRRPRCSAHTSGLRF
ncbi:hypothetical protein NDU88_004387 [Pleurodeles waltl]|uniref:Secreted protein n=1 Tax=Pleurodeles waltl TaxID=8319 RepID=A0AAV7L1C4_PLEWA|nr:hypothetical protein NDU88_004387 [Pleurodeles waltl]